MEKTKEIKQIICKWDSSLETFGKIDQRQLDRDLVIIDSYVSSNCPSPFINALRRMMYWATTPSPDDEQLQKAVKTSLKKVSAQIAESKYGTPVSRTTNAETYQYATKRIFNERMRFKENRYLRNIDPELEDGETARKVRRIVEKRMYQAYYKSRKGCSCNEDRRDKMGEINATSYQMRNLGQIDMIEGLTRTDATHWKRCFDNVTGREVMRPKKGYETLEEAEEAARMKNLELLSGTGKSSEPYSAYRCAYCGKYHIGHRGSSNRSRVYNPASANRNLYDGHSFAC